MANIVKELEKQAIKTRESLKESSVIIDANRLLSEKGVEDYQMLRSMGMHSSLIQAENIRGRKLELENLDKKYGKVFTIEEIKKLACKYALKFLRSDKYKGIVDPVILQKMREFGKETGVELNSYNLQYKFFVLAPSSAFKLAAAEKNPPPDDPVLFYKIDENHFRMIHKWGNDFSILRRIIGWKYESSLQYSLFFAIIITAILGGIVGAFTGVNMISFIVSGLIFLFSFCICISSTENSNNGRNKWKDWSESWNDEYKNGF